MRTRRFPLIRSLIATLAVTMMGVSVGEAVAYQVAKQPFSVNASISPVDDARYLPSADAQARFRFRLPDQLRRIGNPFGLT